MLESNNNSRISNLIIRKNHSSQAKGRQGQKIIVNNIQHATNSTQSVLKLLKLVQNFKLQQNNKNNQNLKIHDSGLLFSQRNIYNHEDNKNIGISYQSLLYKQNHSSNKLMINPLKQRINFNIETKQQAKQQSQYQLAYQIQKIQQYKSTQIQSKYNNKNTQKIKSKTKIINSKKVTNSILPILKIKKDIEVNNQNINPTKQFKSKFEKIKLQSISKSKKNIHQYQSNNNNNNQGLSLAVKALFLSKRNRILTEADPKNQNIVQQNIIEAEEGIQMIPTSPRHYNLKPNRIKTLSFSTGLSNNSGISKNMVNQNKLGTNSYKKLQNLDQPIKDNQIVKLQKMLLQKPIQKKQLQQIGQYGGWGITPPQIFWNRNKKKYNLQRKYENHWQFTVADALEKMKQK